MPRIFNIKFIVSFLILSGGFGYSQTSNRIILECKSEILKPGNPSRSLDFSSALQPRITNHSFMNPMLPGKKPIFCRMEDNLHKRFNVWIVMRAGSDEDYKKLITEKDKPKHEKIP